MLVLSRKPNQKICIGDSITISVVRVHGNTIRLGIEAPKDIRVMRSELMEVNEADLSTTRASHDAISQE